MLELSLVVTNADTKQLQNKIWNHTKNQFMVESSFLWPVPTQSNYKTKSEIAQRFNSRGNYVWLWPMPIQSFSKSKSEKAQRIHPWWNLVWLWPVPIKNNAWMYTNNDGVKFDNCKYRAATKYSLKLQHNASKHDSVWNHTWNLSIMKLERIGLVIKQLCNSWHA